MGGEEKGGVREERGRSGRMLMRRKRRMMGSEIRKETKVGEEKGKGEGKDGRRRMGRGGTGIMGH